MRARAVRWLIALALLSPAADAAGQGPDAARQRAGLLREQLESLEQSIREHEGGLARDAHREQRLLKELEASALELQRHRRKSALLEAELEELDRNVQSTQAAVADLTRRCRAAEAAFARRLVALYKASWFGAEPALATAGSVTELVQRRNALRRIMAHDRQAGEAQLAHRQELARLQSRLSAQQQDRRARLEEHARRVAAADEERERRGRLLARVQAEMETRQAAVADLRRSAEALSRKIAGLGRTPPPRAKAESPATGPFSALKGLLIHPVEGKIINLYGPYTLPDLKVQGFRSGVDFAAARGEPVRAVSAGTIVYAGWFRGYGNVVIVDHGEHYYTVYAHLEDVFKSVGSGAGTGEVIGTAGDAGALGATGLHFEVRHHDKALNPAEWLRPG